MTEENIQEAELQEEVKEPQFIIDQLAIEHRAVVELDDEFLKEKFNEYWAEYGEMLVRQHNYKGKKLKGGKIDLDKAKAFLEKSVGENVLYRRVVAELLGDMVEDKTGKTVMTVNSVRLHGYNVSDMMTMGVITYYYWPEITLDKDKLDLTLVRRGNFDFEHHLESRKKSLQHTKAQYKKYEGEGVNESQRVLIDIIASCNKEPYAELTSRGSWIEVKHIQPKEIQEEVLKHNSGDLFEVNFDNPIPGDLNGETAHAHVKVYEVQDIEYLDLEDDELYEVSGFESKQDFEDKFKVEFEEYKENASKYQAFNEIIQRILSMAESFDMIPNRWYDVNLDTIIQRHIDQNGGDKYAAFKAAGARDMNDLKDKFQSRLYQETVQQMAYNWYAKAFNCIPDHESISTDLITRVVWQDPEPPKEEE